MILSNSKILNIKDEAVLRQNKIATQLSNGAIDHINGTNPELIKEAINYISAMVKANDKDFPEGVGSLMDYLERKTKVDLTLNTYAKTWDEVSKKDFADAFRMPSDKLDVMDAIVSISMLNEKTLPAQLAAENTPETTVQDLLENHRIIYQYPPPGTPLQLPSVILVAVEYQELAKAEEIVKSIVGQLEDYQGIKLPKLTAQKLVPNQSGAMRAAQPLIATRVAQPLDVGRVVQQSDIGRALQQSDVGRVVQQSDVGRVVQQSDVGRVVQQSDIGRVVQQSDIGRVVQQSDIGRVVQQSDIGRVVQQSDVGRVVQQSDVGRVVQQSDVGRVVQQSGDKILAGSTRKRIA